MGRTSKDQYTITTFEGLSDYYLTAIFLPEHHHNIGLWLKSRQSSIWYQNVARSRNQEQLEAWLQVCRDLVKQYRLSPEAEYVSYGTTFAGEFMIAASIVFLTEAGIPHDELVLPARLIFGD